MLFQLCPTDVLVTGKLWIDPFLHSEAIWLIISFRAQVKVFFVILFWFDTSAILYKFFSLFFKTFGGELL